MATEAIGRGQTGRDLRDPDQSIHSTVQSCAKQVWSMVDETNKVIQRLHGLGPEVAAEHLQPGKSEDSTMGHFGDLQRAISQLENNVGRLSSSVG